MAKPEKVKAVQEIRDRLKKADAALLTEYRGLKVGEMKELRSRLAEGGTEFRVVKNSLTRLAVKEADLEELLPMLEGSTAIAFITGDPVEAAQGLDEIARKYPSLVLKGGVVEGQILDAERARALARVKPREQLLTDLAGMLQAPMQKVVILLAAPLRDLGYALGAYRAKIDEESAPEPEEQAPSPDAGVAETPEAAAPDEGEPEAEAEGQPEETEAEGQSEETEAEGQPEETEAEGQPEETEAEGQPPDNETPKEE